MGHPVYTSTNIYIYIYSYDQRAKQTSVTGETLPFINQYKGILGYCDTTVVGDYINIIKTTFNFNFDLYPGLNSMNKQNMDTKRSCK